MNSFYISLKKLSFSKTCGRLISAIFIVAVMAAYNNCPAGEQVYWQKAGEFISSGDLNAAIEELDRLLLEYPEDTLLLRLKGICHIGNMQADQAVPLLQRAIEIEPANPAPRFYLAKAFAQQGSILEAIDLLRSVEEISPESQYAVMAQERLSQLRSAAAVMHPGDDRKRWNLFFGLSFQYDDNVPARSRHEPVTSTGSLRTITSGALEYRLIDQNLDQWDYSLGARYSLYYSWHGRNKFTSYDLGYNSGDIFFSRNGRIYNLPYDFSLTGNYSYTSLGRKSYSERAGGEAKISVQWIENCMAEFKYSTAWEDFKYDTDYPQYFSRDGMFHNVGLNHYLRLFSDKVLWGLGYEHRIADTTGTQFNENSYNLFSSFDITLPHDISFFSRLDYTNVDYTKFVTKPRRMDDIITVNTSIKYPLSSVNNFFIEGGYTYLQSGSNLDFADYKRQVFTLSLNSYL